MRSITLAIFIFIVANIVQAQPSATVPKGVFWKDTLMVGEHVQYSLSITYPQEEELIFPDSSYNFFPFEYVEKEYFPTRVDGNFLTDSVVYTLRTFETDSVLYLRSPVFILEGDDSLRYYTEADSVLFKSAVTQMPEKPELKADTNYVTVEKQFNYIYFLIGAAIIFIIIGVLIAVFGRRAYRWFKIYRLKRSHKKFSEKYKGIIQSVSTQNTKEVTSEVLTLWKRYMEKTEKMPITKYTSKEITKVFTNEELRSALRELDKNIYGSYSPENIKSYYEQLLQFSESRLSTKIEEVKHG